MVPPVEVSFLSLPFTVQKKDGPPSTPQVMCPKCNKRFQANRLAQHMENCSGATVPGDSKQLPSAAQIPRRERAGSKGGVHREQIWGLSNDQTFNDFAESFQVCI